MESNPEGRNNHHHSHPVVIEDLISMESGLEGRNNDPAQRRIVAVLDAVSMKSGLEDRNNRPIIVDKLDFTSSQ